MTYKVKEKLALGIISLALLPSISFATPPKKDETQKLRLTSEEILAQVPRSRPGAKENIKRVRPGRDGLEKSTPLATEKVEGEKRKPAKKVHPPMEEEFVSVHDRWSMFYQGKWYDPYNQNRLKGDLPIFGEPGEEWFMELELVSLSLVEQRNLPTAVGVSSTRAPGSTDVFGDFSQILFEENLILQAALIKGNTVFKPQDFELRVAPIFSANHVNVGENGFLRADPARGDDRDDQHIGFRELFLDIHLADVSDRYDFVSSRVGIQRFNSDFRGFAFFDEAPGVRFFGTLDNNKTQWNTAWFSRLDKDANALQNKIFDTRDEQVLVANVYRQDLIMLGHTMQGVVIHREDTAGDEGFNYDDNNFLVRPASLGDERAKNIYSTYLGLNSDGHLGPVNVTTSYYYVFGSESHNSIPGRATEIDAHMGAVEVSKDYNWLRLRTSFFWASGDSDPLDGKAEGFDAIIDNPQFAGGDTSYWQRQGIPLIAGGGVALVNRFSLLPDLRAGKEQGQSNFVNPGIWLYNIGFDIQATPKLQITTNLNYLYFDDTASLETLRQDGSIDSEIGIDLSTGILYRPFLNNNVQIRVGTAALFPGKGLKNLYGDETLYQAFSNLILLY